jgi:hypothetical protein
MLHTLLVVREGRRERPRMNGDRPAEQAHLTGLCLLAEANPA